MPLKRASRAPTVVLVGRPNVGKSTLFNRITDSRRAIVTPIAGTTRDVIAQPAEWQGTPFTLVDTGGMFGASEDPLHELVVAAGPTGARSGRCHCVRGRWPRRAGARRRGDRRSAADASNAPVAHRGQQDRRQARARAGRSSSTSSGFEPVVEIAAEHGEGVGDLLDEVIARLPARPRRAARATSPEETAVAIVGRPNVGKSSLLNRLLREERSIVSDMPGTTRDTVDAVLKWHKRTFRIVDTAGIRRPGRVARSGQVEARQRRRRATGDREGRRRRARDRLGRRGDRSGRRDRRRGREGRAAASSSPPTSGT